MYNLKKTSLLLIITVLCIYITLPCFATTNTNYVWAPQNQLVPTSGANESNGNTQEGNFLNLESGAAILVEQSTGQIIYSEEANGTAETEASTTLGIGGHAGFDATLSDKAIEAAISQLVENIINNCMDRPWKSFILSYDNDAVIISGGKAQGLKAGDTFDVLIRGKKVKNPQTGMMIELPGTKVGTVQILMTGGEDPTNEYSIVELSGTIDRNNLGAYIIQEQK